MKIIAHRGASHLAPENTLAAVHLALKEGADGVEVDVHLSLDDQIMVIHDSSALRTGKRRRWVADLKAAELQQMDVGSWKGERWKGERIPRLSEVIKLLPPGKELLVEVKCGAEFLASFASLKCSPSHQLILIGFDLALMKQVKESFPRRRVLWVTTLSHRFNWEKPGGAMDRLLDQVRAARLDGLDLDARGPMTPKMMDRFRRAGLQVYVWTVDTAAEARRFARLGVDGLTTNRPAAMRAALGAPKGGDLRGHRVRL